MLTPLHDAIIKRANFENRLSKKKNKAIIQSSIVINAHVVTIKVLLVIIQKESRKIIANPMVRSVFTPFGV